jgi:hypothetical protein
MVIQTRTQLSVKYCRIRQSTSATDSVDEDEDEDLPAYDFAWNEEMILRCSLLAGCHVTFHDSFVVLFELMRSRSQHTVEANDLAVISVLSILALPFQYD